MDYWILDNLDKLVPFVIALLYFIGSSKLKKAETQQSEPGPEASDRARGIQEEIRRKILERQQKGRPASPAESERPSIFFEDETPEPSPVLHPTQSKSSREVAEVEVRGYNEPERLEDVWEDAADTWEDPFDKQRREIEEQLQKARELKANAPAVKAPVASVKWHPHQYTDRRADAFRDAVREDLQEQGSVRRAIALKEILDSPLALR